MPQKELKSPKKIGGGLREKLKEVAPHSKGDKILSRGGSKMISKEDMLTRIYFLVPEVEAKVEEELSRVLHVVRTTIKPWTIQTGKWTEEKLTSLRRRGVTWRMKTLEVGNH